MAWIKSHQELRDHPKTRKLAHILGVSRPTAIGHLQCLWWWALDYADDGDLSKFDEIDIALGADWDADSHEFVQALIAVGFIDVCEAGGLYVHDWDDYAGTLVRRRRANTERMRDARAQHVRAHTSTRAEHVAMPDKTREEKSRQEKTKEENNAEPTASANAPNDKTKTPDDLFEEFWDAYGKKINRPLSERSFAKAIKRTDLETMLTAIEVQKKSRKWRDGYQPNPSTWLNGDGWDDELEPISHNQGGDISPSNQKQPEPATDVDWGPDPNLAWMLDPSLPKPWEKDNG